MLSPADRAEIKAKAEKLIVRFEQDIVELVELTKPISPDNSYGRLSRLDAINNKSINEAALAESRARLQQLEQVMVAVDKESFGTCVSCGKPIEVLRLKVMPDAKSCITCAKRGR